MKSYALVDRIPGPDGGYDYLSIDSASQRLFVAREYGVMAVDVATKTVTQNLIEANDVSAVLIIPNTGLMLSTVYGADQAVLFDRTSGAVKAQIATGKRPDAALFEPVSGLVLVMNAGSNDATLIDPSAAAAIATIAIGGKPEAGVADGKGRVYVNVEDTAQVAVIDVAQRKVMEHFALPGCVEPTGIAYDAASNLLLSACHNRVLKLIDATSGADRGSIEVGENADGSLFDAQRRLAYVPCKDGTLSIIRVSTSGEAEVVQVVATQRGARTATFDPPSGRIYLAARDEQADAKGERVPVAGTFNVLVVAPSLAQESE